MTQAARHDKKQRILEATLQLLASSGFHGFSMKQLAAEAGVATGTIYLYFKDRDTLIAELHSQIIHDFADAVFSDHDPNQPLKQQYQKICANLWHFCINHRCVTLSKAQFDHLPTDILRSQRETAWQRLQPLRTLFEQGRQQGLIKLLADDVLASLSFEPYTYMASQHLLKVIDVDESQLQHIMDASWDAIATNAGHSRL
jgi:TetR/AcrR family transcriptional repressor of multidrug resistance operon